MPLLTPLKNLFSSCLPRYSSGGYVGAADPLGPTPAVGAVHPGSFALPLSAVIKFVPDAQPWQTYTLDQVALGQVDAYVVGDPAEYLHQLSREDLEHEAALAGVNSVDGLSNAELIAAVQAADAGQEGGAK